MINSPNFLSPDTQISEQLLFLIMPMIYLYSYHIYKQKITILIQFIKNAYHKVLLIRLAICYIYNEDDNFNKLKLVFISPAETTKKYQTPNWINTPQRIENIKTFQKYIKNQNQGFIIILIYKQLSKSNHKGKWLEWQYQQFCLLYCWHIRQQPLECHFTKVLVACLFKGRWMYLCIDTQPIKLQVRLPAIPNKLQDEKFRLTLTDFATEETLFDVLLQEKTIYRKNEKLEYNKMYQLCIEVYTSRNGFNPKTEKIYAEYTADQDFDSLIGNIQIPEELRGQANLKYIYNISEAISHLNRRIAQNQAQEREIEESIATSNLHKNQKINLFTVVECLVIVLSGVYQIMALRRFLIQKNLY